MLNIQSRLRSSCWHVIREAYPVLSSLNSSDRALQQLNPYRVNGRLHIQPRSLEHRFKLGKTGNDESTREVVASHLRACSEVDATTVQSEVGKPISFLLNKDFAGRQVQDVVVNGPRLLDMPAEQRKRVVIDFSSPNIAKELHVGHLRSTVIGDSLANILEFCGHDIIRQNHVGDWGTQFGMLITHLLREKPGLRDGNASAGLSMTLSELQSCYQAAKEHFDASPEFKKESLAAVVRLQSKEALEVRLWQMICDVSRKAYNELYDRLNVSITERGESFYAPFIPEVLKLLEDRGALVTDDNGRRIVHAEGIKVPLILVKSDGGYTYAATDMAALWHRANTVKADWLVYVVDVGQSLHFKTLFAAARQFGVCPDSVRLDHVAFGLVCGENGKRIKTRSGDSVKLVELLDEAQSRAGSILTDRTYPTEEARNSVRDAVAYGCIRFADLKTPCPAKYEFSSDAMLDMHGDTAIYLMYVLARLKSIQKLVNLTDEEIVDLARQNPPVLTHQHEVELAQAILGFPEVVEDMAAEKLQPHRIAVYLFELARAFTQFYGSCYVVESDPATKKVIKVHNGRVILCKAAGVIMTQALSLLGVRVPEYRM